MKIDNKIISKINRTGTAAIQDLVKSMHKLEGDMITLAENQIEFEKYLKDILKCVKNESSD